MEPILAEMNLDTSGFNLGLNQLRIALFKPFTDIKDVIINDNRVIVILKNGNKGIATCSYDDEFDFFQGFTLAYMYAEKEITKKDYHHIVNKWKKRANRKNK